MVEYQPYQRTAQNKGEKRSHENEPVASNYIYINYQIKGYRPLCQVPVCQLRKFGVCQIADITYDQYSKSDTSQY